ncbi:MAG: ribosome maturation factor RimM [Streptosporangiales bacterium]|nr:ribosome maturation factor RimM [Streptosporangiales bacterium]
MLIVIGRVLRAHGLRGDVLVDVRTDEPARRFRAGAVLRRGDGTGALTIEAASPHADRMRVRFAEAGDRTSAEGLRGVELVFDSDDLTPSTDPDDVHDLELIGSSVVTTDGAEVGTVTDVLHPAQDVLVIERATGGEVLVPFVAAMVPVVDLANRRLVVDPPPGLLDDEEG